MIAPGLCLVLQRGEQGGGVTQHAQLSPAYRAYYAGQPIQTVRSVFCSSRTSVTSFHAVSIPPKIKHAPNARPHSANPGDVAFHAGGNTDLHIGSGVSVLY